MKGMPCFLGGDGKYVQRAEEDFSMIISVAKADGVAEKQLIAQLKQRSGEADAAVLPRRSARLLRKSRRTEMKQCASIP